MNSINKIFKYKTNWYMCASILNDNFDNDNALFE